MPPAPEPVDVKATARIAQQRQAHRDIPIPRDRRKDVARPPGPGTVATTRNMLSPTRAPWFIAELEREYPSVAHLKLFGSHRYVLNAPELVVELFVGNAHNTVKGPAFDAIRAFVGNGLLTAEGPTHLAHRRLAQPAFHRDRIAEYSRAMVELTIDHEHSWSDGQQVDMSVDMSNLTLTIVGRALFGTDISGSASEAGQALRRTLHAMGRYANLGSALWKYPSPARTKAAEALATLDGVVNRIIAEHRATGNTGDILSLLLDAREEDLSFDDEQVRDEVLTLVIAGHETTAMAITWTWMLLAQHPAQAEWLHEELDTALGGRPPTMDDVSSLPRTRAAFAESIRLYPPAWIYGRRLLTDIELGGWTIPAGANAMASPFAIQRSPRWWDAPTAFVPSRWIDSTGAFDEHAPGVPRGAWLPFGFGNRKCIGEHFAWTEGTLILATLAQQWAPAMASSAPVQPESAITLRPHGGMPMVLRRR